MDKSPLEIQYDQFDTDHDGKINHTQAFQLLKLLGKNVYSGSVQHAVRLVNYETEEEFLTFEQFKQYYESFENKFKEEMWKAKYEVLTSIRQMSGKKKQEGGEESSAAPGMGGGALKAPEDPTEGDIEVTIGPENQNYQNYVEVILEKTPKEESKPYLKIVFEQNSVEEAKKLEELIKQFHKNIVQFIKEESPDMDQLVDSFNVITNVAGNRLNLFITTSSQDLIDFAQLISEFWDRVLEQRIEAKINYKYNFALDIPEFLKNDSGYSFYEMLTKNCHMKLTWTGCNFKESLKRILATQDAFSEFKYDKSEPGGLFLIALLHTNLCQIQLTFDNATEHGNETQFKNEMLNELSEMVFQLSSWQDESSFNSLQLISAINNHVKIEASMGDWKAQLNFKIKDFNLLFEPRDKVDVDSD